ncbi:MAG TPA: hypothetical protein VM734_26880 [Kofleriaceae bacterium]|nr:hypothetical protein [Kofleriaceae bacterium]
MSPRLAARVSVRRLTLAAAVLASAISGAAHADPVTLGVEWELASGGHGVDLSVATEDRGHDNPRYSTRYAKVAGQEIRPRLLCTTVRAERSTYPLVSFTYDMHWAAYPTRHLRTLEIVSGPLAPDATQWDDVLVAIARFYQAASAICDDPGHAIKPTRADGTKRTYCAVPVAELAARSGGTLTTACHADGADLDATAADDIRFVFDQSVDPTEVFGSELSTQVSVGVDLDRFDAVGSLFAADSRGTIGELAFRKSARLAEGEADPVVAAFKRLYALELQVWVAYFYQEKGADRDHLAWGQDAANAQELVDRVKQHTIGYEDWRLKNLFEVLPKAPLPAVLNAIDPSRRADVLSSLTTDQVCPTDVFAGIALELFELEPDVACRALHEQIWKPRLARGEDPLDLAAIGTPIPLLQTRDGKPRMVFEVRRLTPLVRSRRFAAVEDVSDRDDFKVEFRWAGPLALPHALAR